MDMYETFASQCNMLLRANIEACKRIELLKQSGVLLDNNVRISCVNSTKIALISCNSQGCTRAETIIDAKNVTSWDEKEVLDKAIDMLGELIAKHIVKIVMHIREEVRNAKV